MLLVLSAGRVQTLSCTVVGYPVVVMQTLWIELRRTQILQPTIQQAHRRPADRHQRNDQQSEAGKRPLTPVREQFLGRAYQSSVHDRKGCYTKKRLGVPSVIWSSVRGAYSPCSSAQRYVVGTYFESLFGGAQVGIGSASW